MHSTTCGGYILQQIVNSYKGEQISLKISLILKHCLDSKSTLLSYLCGVVKRDTIKVHTNHDILKEYIKICRKKYKTERNVCITKVKIYICNNRSQLLMNSITNMQMLLIIMSCIKRKMIWSSLLIDQLIDDYGWLIGQNQ